MLPPYPETGPLLALIEDCWFLLAASVMWYLLARMKPRPRPVWSILVVFVNASLLDALFRSLYMPFAEYHYDALVAGVFRAGFTAGFVALYGMAFFVQKPKQRVSWVVAAFTAAWAGMFLLSGSDQLLVVRVTLACVFGLAMGLLCYWNPDLRILGIVTHVQSKRLPHESKTEKKEDK